MAKIALCGSFSAASNASPSPASSSAVRNLSRLFSSRRHAIRVDELVSENLLLLNVGHCFRDQVLDACPELNRGDAPVTRTSSLETVRNMVASGLGVSVLPRDALTPKYHSRLVVPVPFASPVPSRRIGLAYRKSFPRPGAIAVIREAAAACRPVRRRRDATKKAARV